MEGPVSLCRTAHRRALRGSQWGGATRRFRALQRRTNRSALSRQPRSLHTRDMRAGERANPTSFADRASVKTHLELTF